MAYRQFDDTLTKAEAIKTLEVILPWLDKHPEDDNPNNNYSSLRSDLLTAASHAAKQIWET